MGEPNFVCGATKGIAVVHKIISNYDSLDLFLLC